MNFKRVLRGLDLVGAAKDIRGEMIAAHQKAKQNKDKQIEIKKQQNEYLNQKIEELKEIDINAGEILKETTKDLITIETEATSERAKKAPELANTFLTKQKLELEAAENYKNATKKAYDYYTNIYVFPHTYKFEDEVICINNVQNTKSALEALTKEVRTAESEYSKAVNEAPLNNTSNGSVNEAPSNNTSRGGKSRRKKTKRRKNKRTNRKK